MFQPTGMFWMNIKKFFHLNGKVVNNTTNSRIEQSVSCTYQRDDR